MCKITSLAKLIINYKNLYFLFPNIHCLLFPLGIFKIEDSAHVARLWGLRKNRPAMNYDKLSRSIRQYYKKGIIRKPDVSQRLVYQFVHPVWGRAILGGVQWGYKHHLAKQTSCHALRTPKPYMKMRHKTHALTNPIGTHFCFQWREICVKLFMQERRWQPSVTVGALFSYCRIKKTSIIKINALYFHLHDLPLLFPICVNIPWWTAHIQIDISKKTFHEAFWSFHFMLICLHKDFMLQTCMWLTLFFVLLWV